MIHCEELEIVEDYAEPVAFAVVVGGISSLSYSDGRSSLLENAKKPVADDRVADVCSSL